MSDWNFDIGTAPRGSVQKVTRTIGKNTVEVEEYVAVKIIAAGNGGVVTTSHWMPGAERWQMFSKSTPPLAWMPWPTHPSEDAAWPT